MNRTPYFHRCINQGRKVCSQTLCQPVCQLTLQIHQLARQIHCSRAVSLGNIDDNPVLIPSHGRTKVMQLLDECVAFQLPCIHQMLVHLEEKLINHIFYYNSDRLFKMLPLKYSGWKGNGRRRSYTETKTSTTVIVGHFDSKWWQGITSKTIELYIHVLDAWRRWWSWWIVHSYWTESTMQLGPHWWIFLSWFVVILWFGTLAYVASWM